MRQARKRVAGVDAGLLIKDAAKLLPDPSRRLFLRNAASLGALALLTGCDIVDGPSAEKALRNVSEFNDWVQARLFNPNRLAPDLSRERDHAPVPVQRLLSRSGSARCRRGALSGSSSMAWSTTSSRGRWTQLYALPQETQITRLICVEGWSAIGKWTGVPLREFLHAHRRRPHRQVRALRLRRGLFESRSTCRPRCIRRRR